MGKEWRVKHIEGNSVDGVVDEFFFYSEISVICREVIHRKIASGLSRFIPFVHCFVLVMFNVRA